MIPFESYRQFEHLLIEHLNIMYATALRLTGFKEGAEDLVQESSLKAFRKFGQLRDVNKAKGWFLQILLNTFRDRYRKKKRKAEVVYVELTEELVAFASIKAYDQEKIFNYLVEGEVQGALSKLPSEFRSVVILCDLQDCSYQEIADILQCPLGTVASRLFRGRELLREYLEGYVKNRGLLELNDFE
ncbi:MAG: RNA polymerase sigma factor [Candidatus Marinimicrobia bacterium]|nr:RNA polymerase sigma factor [Candidatus Neomarinimicrobiota bacterium]MCH7763808.1 RNA polymerase sigma factor [Candidatus Neomarinimicrobiota bacterium]